LKRVPRRRMCRLKTKEQFFNEYQSYLDKKEKEDVADLFRRVNREMKVSAQKSEGNIFYQNIRKEALHKIDHMYCNQKYYDDQEVKQLHSVVDSCNVLIHKKHSKIDAKPLYNMPKVDSSLRDKQRKEGKLKRTYISQRGFNNSAARYVEQNNLTTTIEEENYE
jgi:hypothetical protein